MFAEQSATQDPYHQALAELSKLRHSSAAPAEFWPGFLRCTAILAGAGQAVLVIRKAATPDNWQKLTQWSGNSQVDRFTVSFQQQLRDFAVACARDGTMLMGLDPSGTSRTKPFAAAVRLEIPKLEDLCVAIYLLLNITEDQAQEALRRLELAADAPASYQTSQLIEQAKADSEKFATTLDLMVQVNAEKRHLAAALAFCNGLAARHRCDRVSLGWQEKGFVRLQAMSHTEKFDRNMVAAKNLEIAMEEALDQDEEIVWPAPEGSTAVTRDHDIFARDQNVKFLCSVPIRLDSEVVGVLTCERQTDPFAQNELTQLRLYCDQAARRLSDLKRLDRWFGARLLASAREKLAKLVGVEHTWTKTLVALTALVLILVLVVRLNYRVESKFIIKSDTLAYLTAPFDGFIEEVPVRVGEPLKKSQPLLSLDRNELWLEEAAAVADLGRYTREAEKARAAKSMAEMRIAEALANQASARLELVRYRLSQAVLLAPFDGVVVEGDQRERIGAPTKQGEVLFKVAAAEGTHATLYVEAEVHERDIHQVTLGATGEVAFVSQPKLKFPVRVVLIQAAALPKEGENVFLVRCNLADKIQSWWRPGMTGVCKINVGKRPLIWILTHRTVDYLRLLLWW